MSAPMWRKSSRSGGTANTDCVEVAGFPGAIGVRDSKNPHGGRLAVSNTQFATLLRRIKAGSLDL